MNTLSWTLGAFFFTLGALGCSGSVSEAAPVGGGPGDSGAEASAPQDSGPWGYPPAPPPEYGVPVSEPLHAAALALAQAQCSQLRGCYGSMLSVSLRGQDCETFYQAQIEDRYYAYMQKLINAGTAAFNSSKIAGCASVIAQTACERNLDLQLALCKAAFTSPVAYGGDCRVDLECTGDLYCDLPGSFNGYPYHGTCKSRVGQGQKVSNSGGCISGLIPSVLDSSCVPGGKPGDSCGQALPQCAGLGLCIVDPGQTTGRCRLPKDLQSADLGQGCDLNAGPWCQEGLICATESFNGETSLKCQAPIDGGTACQFSFPNSCSSGQYCAQVDWSEPYGRCENLPGEGQSCNTNVLGSPECQSGYVCDEQKCLPMRRLREPCTSDSQCYSGACAAEGCAVPPVWYTPM